MAGIQKMTTYDLKGNKLSFANWVSNISPTETPFASMTGKEAISQTKFQWQTDYIPPVKKDNAQKEGSKPTDDDPFATAVRENNTQIFRRGASVSDTANVVQYYGRGKEIGYQMEKAALELRRDIEKALLTNAGATAAATDTAPKTAGFVGQVVTSVATGTAGWKKLSEIKVLATDNDKKNYWEPDTGAALAFKTKAADIDEGDIFDMTYNLYLANSKANIIMYHPSHAVLFSGMMEGVTTGPGAVLNNRLKMFDNVSDTYNVEVDTLIDPLGQRFALVPNRYMPLDEIFFFNPSDWTQMVLRAPKKIQLAKQGSSEEWMIEAELGLRHRNPYASGVLKIKS